MKNLSGGLIDRETLLAHAKLLLSKEQYTQEDSARVGGLLSLAEKLGANGETRASERSKESCTVWERLKYGNRGELDEAEKRDLLESGVPFSSLATSVLVAQDYDDRFNIALRAYDRLFDPDVTNHITASPGAPLPMPIIDDTQSSAVVVAEGAENTEVDPGVSAVMLAAAPTFRTGRVLVSNDMLQDAAFDLKSLLSAAFAVRMARGIGVSLVNTLLTSAPVSVTATGSSKNSGGSETGGASIGSVDLVNLRKSVNSAYRAGGRAWWVMNDDTLAAIDSLLNKQGSPIFHPERDAEGNRLLLGYPVALCPSMPDIGLNAKPVAFGAMDRFAVRRSNLAVSRMNEMYAEFDKSAFYAGMRCNGTLLIPAGGDSPIKVLQNAAA